MTQKIMLYEATYLEAAQLMAELRNYLSYQIANDTSDNDHNQKLEINFQAMIVSSRLTECMTWLLMQRALTENSLSFHEALQKKWRLDKAPLLDQDDWSHYGYLPHGLKSLIHRSKKLMSRLRRLDDQTCNRLQEAI